MEVSSILSNSVHYASQLVEHFDKLFVLAVFAVIPVANLLVLGYFARVIRTSPLGSSLPPLDSWGRMFVDGITLLVLSLCYLAAGVVSTLILFYLGSSQMALLGTLVVFLGYFLLPIALVHAIKTGDPLKAFALREIYGKIQRVGVVDYFIFVLVIFVLPLLILAPLLMVPFLGWFIGFLAVPIIGTFIARASALAYGF
jgi:hypothetical protein